MPCESSAPGTPMGAKEWSVVADEAKKAGKKVHVGRLFSICVEKGSELPQGSPGRKFKGRVVFQGSNVKDEHSYNALFNDLGSSPAASSANKLIDAYGCRPGRVVEVADGVRAYTQAPLMGVRTWIRLPRDQLPAEFQHLRDPVFRSS